jgi:hypothetical protein
MYKSQTNPMLSLLNNFDHIIKAIEFDNATTPRLNKKKTWDFFDLLLFYGAKAYIGLVGYKTYTDVQKLLKSF